MRRLLVIMILILLGSSHLYPQSKKEKKAEAAAKEFAETKDLIDSKKFVFEADWANTFGGLRVNLISNPNYLRVSNDSVQIFLPYFGQGQSNSAYKSGGAGIEYEGLVMDYEQSINEKKLTLTIKFKARAKSELYDMSLLVFKSGSANLNVSSNARSGIKYDGKVRKMDEKKN